MDTIDSMNLGMFYIYGLFNQYNIQFDLSKRCNVFIGENGIGKTTILRILDLLFEGKFDGLISYPFEKIVVERKSRDSKDKITINYSDLFPEFDSVYIRTKERFMPRIPSEVMQSFDIDESDLKSENFEEIMSHWEGLDDYLAKKAFQTNALELLTQLRDKELLNKYYSDIYLDNEQTANIEQIQQRIFVSNESYPKYEAIELFDRFINDMLLEHLKTNAWLLELVYRISRVSGGFDYKKNYYINMVSDFKIDAAKVTSSSVSSSIVSWIKDALSVGCAGYGAFIALGLESALGENVYELLKELCLNADDFSLDDIGQNGNKKYMSNGKNIFNIDRPSPTRVVCIPLILADENLSELQTGYIEEVLNNHVFPVNRMINRIYFEDEFVIDFNIRAMEICSVFLGVIWGNEENDEKLVIELDRVLGEKIREILYSIEDPRAFLRKPDVEADIRDYFHPILAKDSVFIEPKMEDTWWYALIALYLDQVDNLKNESNRSAKLKKLVKLLDKYINNKLVVVNPSGISFKKYKVLSEEEMSGSLSSSIFKEIGIDMLSSGETKLLLIFTLAVYIDYHDYRANSPVFSKYKDYEFPIYILLDEPELSISIIWQESLLPDLLRETDNVKFIAATHSPYIIADETMKKNIVFLPTEVIIKGDE